MAEHAGRGFFVRVTALIGICTLLLTASFIGVLAFISGSGYISNLQSRMPWYIVIAAVGFVGTIILLEANDSSGRVILITAAITTLITAILIPLAVEGILFAFQFPEKVFVSQLVLYFFAAGLIGTGLGYWGINHWREFTGQPPSRL